MFTHEIQNNHILSTYYAPRGRSRIYNLGITIAQQYLSPFDRLIGIMGDPGCGKSALVKGMFPGIELTNDDDGVNVRPLPILSVGEEEGFFQPHTYHLDIRFETGFTQLPVLADAIMTAIHMGKRVVVEHFELVYPLLPMNADLLIGIGAEIVVARPNIFGPEPTEIYQNVHESLRYRLMSHTAEDLCEQFLGEELVSRCVHGDVSHGFTMTFEERPDVDPKDIENYVREMIEKKLPVTYFDESHVMIGDHKHTCTGPRTHVHNTGDIENFHLLWRYIRDYATGSYILVGTVGENSLESLLKLESIQKHDDFQPQF